MNNNVSEDKNSPPQRIERGPDSNRIFMFLLVQGGFLLISPLAGGYHYKIWSMLDSSLLITAIGITALALIFDMPKPKGLSLKVGVIFYLLAVLDMSINVLISGWVGWKPPIPID